MIDGTEYNHLPAVQSGSTDALLFDRTFENVYRAKGEKEVISRLTVTSAGEIVSSPSGNLTLYADLAIANERIAELERKLAEDWCPLDDDEDLKNPFDDFMEVSTMYGGTAFMLSRYQDGEIIHLPCGYAICKIGEGESDETASQVRSV